MGDGGNRVFKKTSSNGKITLYLGKRDYVDHVDHVDPIDGMVILDPEYLKERKAYVQITCAFRYGRDDLDVLDMTFRKDIYVSTLQVFPPLPEDKKPLTHLQEQLMKKTGGNSYPFVFELPQNLPCSITLQPGPDDAGKQACGVDFEVKAFCAENLEEKIHKRNSVRLLIRKVQFAPERSVTPPKAETTRQFLMSDKPLQLEASLDKELYYHGEAIQVTVNINNSSSKHVKKMRLSVEQITDVVLYSQDKYIKSVCVEEPTDTVGPASTYSKVYSIVPMMDVNVREKRGVALDGKLKYEDTHLASTTMLVEGMDKEVLGMIVSYQIRVKITVGRGGILGDLAASEVFVDLPFTLMHPKPVEGKKATSSSRSLLATPVTARKRWRMRRPRPRGDVTPPPPVT
uniref:Beta-arrestin-1-like isoform X1 n=1 Tax=Petromyzon marinus TaxID=7757 RepID=A0AAJ7U965_PETMA|nr:beta-arrestin-1-like isoform X1 [Petromyzon marinus]